MDVIPESHYNLISISKLIEEGHQVTVEKRMVSLSKKADKSSSLTIDIRVKTRKGVLWCAYIKQPEPEGKVTAGMSDKRVKISLLKV